MKKLYTLSLFILLIYLTACFPEDYDRCGEGFHYKRNDCYKDEIKPSSGDSGTGASLIDKDKWIGSPCKCEGDLCDIAGAPTIHRGNITGCEALPEEWPGALLGCMRTSDNTITIEGAPDFYYAQGFCTLIAMGCNGDETICNSAKRGDYELMTSCPEDTVMVAKEDSVSIVGLSSLVQTKLCAPVCEKDADCRIDDFDEVLNEPGQYECLEKDGVKFCLDSRNLPDDYSAEAF